MAGPDARAPQPAGHDDRPPRPARHDDRPPQPTAQPHRPTVRLASRVAPGRSASPLPARIECNEGVFVASDASPLRSSGKKHLYRGTWQTPAGTSDACLVVYVDKDPAFYGREVSVLHRNTALDVGPRVHALTSCTYEGTIRPIVVEEDAGVSLSEAVFSHVPVPGAGGSGSAPLAPIGSAERAVENDKVIFDVMCQLYNMHRHGMFHLDAKPENICVRRYGPDPRDIRATLIDFDVSSLKGPSDDLRYRTRDYIDVLFGAIPRRIAESTGASVSEGAPVASAAPAPAAAPTPAAPAPAVPASIPAASAAPAPTRLEVDMGYLALVRYMLEHGELPDGEADPQDLSWGEWPLFSYAENGSARARMVDARIDLEPLGRSLGLTHVDEATFPNPVELGLARGEFRHGGFLDARDMARLARMSEERLVPLVEALARQMFEHYKQAMRAQGRPVPFEVFEDQPVDYRQYGDALSIFEKIGSCGLRVVRKDLLGPDDAVVGQFDDDQLEYLAFCEHRRWMDERLGQGWSYAPVKDVVQKTNPLLRPYNELDEGSKELNRAQVRGIPALLEKVGYAIVR